MALMHPPATAEDWALLCARACNQRDEALEALHEHDADEAEALRLSWLNRDA